MGKCADCGAIIGLWRAYLVAWLGLVWPCGGGAEIALKCFCRLSCFIAAYQVILPLVTVLVGLGLYGV